MKKSIASRVFVFGVIAVLMNVLTRPAYLWSRQSLGEEIIPVANSRWIPTGSLNGAREAHSATLLPNGEVLVVGGGGWFVTGNFGSVGVQSDAELYSPATGTWRVAERPSMTHAWGVAAKPLPNGQVLVTGGNFWGSDNRPELYDPITGKWSTIAISAWPSTSLALLPNGKVLMVSSVTNQSGALIYDSSNEAARATNAPLSAVRLTPLANGNVLGIGCGGTPQLYDFVTEQWTITATPNALECVDTATLLADGRVLAIGTRGRYPNLVDVAELYDPDTQSWSKTGPSSLHGPATLLSNGQVLVVGGFDLEDLSVRAAELYDPATGEWNPAPMPIGSRGAHSATLLADGKVLVAGGSEGYCCDWRTTLSTAELFDPGQSLGNPQFEPKSVRAGSPFTATFVGADLTDSTYFDIRFQSPASASQQVTTNWQRGKSATHTVSPATAPGTWIVTGVRPHADINDHSGDFIPVSATLKVSAGAGASN